MQDASENASPETAPPADDPVARLLAESPLNDPTLLEQAFGGLQPASEHVHAGYLDLPLEQRPRLSLLFDPAYYLEQNLDVAAAGIDPYVHFLTSGMEEGRSPHPLVELGFLRSQVQRDCPFWTVAVLADALRTADYRPHPLFDPAFYLEGNDDVRGAGVPALEHFLRSGASEGRRPNRFFDLEAYRSQSDDIPQDGYAAFLHFLRRGDLEGRSPGQGFDGKAYRHFHPELEGTWVGSLAHYLREHPDATPAPPVPPALVDTTVAAEHGADTDTDTDTDRAVEEEREGAADDAPEGDIDASAADAAPEAIEHFQGNFDAIEGGIAAGWAFNPQDPGERLLVEIVADGQVVGRGRAEGLRDDLCAQGIGDGAYHFAVPLARDIADGRTHRLQARVAGGRGAPLHGAHDYRAGPEAHAFDLLSLAQTAALAQSLAAGREEDGYATAIDDASLRLATGRTEEATEALRLLAIEFPGDPLVSLKLAEAELLQGRLAEAAEAYSEATRDHATGGWAWLGLGNVRRLLGDWQQAEHCYLQGCALAPGLEPLQARLKTLRSRSMLSEIKKMVAAGDEDGARALIVAELVSAPENPEVRDLAVRLLVPADGGVDPVVAEARRSLVLLEAVMTHVESRRGHA